MRKSDLVSAVADVADISILEADNAVASMFEHVTGALARGESVSLVGFGSFLTKPRAARKGRNPKTGAEIDIPASIKVQFKPGKLLKDATNV